MKYKDIQWEDEDTGFEGEEKPTPVEEEEDFAKLMAESEIHNLNLHTGQQVQGTILSINPQSETVLIELDPQHTGVMDYQQIVSDQGEQKYHAGDSISAYVVSRKGGEVLLSMNLSQSHQSMQDLRLAQQNEVPVKGKVTGENPGGFDVQIMGKRCFCPVSQIDTRYVQVKAEYIGKEFNFLIEKVEEGGRNIVVSRSKLLQKEAELRLAELEKNLDQDVILDGTVTEVRDYGAFVDIGGIDGFLHVSEMSYSRVSRPSDLYAKGDRVRVKVIKMEKLDGKRRISLSAKAVEEDPWQNAANEFQEGKSYKGRVMRLEAYGAFVELKPGVEGLLHVSEMSWERRVHHPQDLLKLGDFVNVRILSLDSNQKKISLSLKNIEDDPWQDIENKLPLGHVATGQVEQLKGFGAIVSLGQGITGLIPLATLKKAFGESYRKKSSPPKELEVVIRSVDTNERKVLLGLKDVADEDQDNAAELREYLKSQEEKPKVAPKQRGSFGDLLAAKLSGAQSDKS
ncbi:MAG: S1 RNA-binding domain-containing protein [Oligoflexus sp.]